MIIICIHCKKSKDDSEYGLYAGRKRRTCNSCVDYHREYARKNRDRLLEMRRFRYHTDEKGITKLKNSEYMRKVRGNPVRRKQMMATHIKRKYGLAINDYDELLKQQQNKCAICKVSFPESFQNWNRPCVDHCHQTNKVRGILCRMCNLSLFYIENFKHWNGAREYLKFNGAEDKEPLT